MSWVARIGCVLISTVSLSLLVACEEKPPKRTCDPGGPKIYDTCYDRGFRDLHFYLEELRERYREGEYTKQDLPQWAIKRDFRGAPLIYDIRAKETPFPTPADAEGRLKEWAKRQGLSPIGDEYGDRTLASTEEEVREAVGGPPDSTTWTFDMEYRYGETPHWQPVEPSETP